jgi:hypothetical protein
VASQISVGAIELGFIAVGRDHGRFEVIRDCICSHDTGHMWEASSPHLLQNL